MPARPITLLASVLSAHYRKPQAVERRAPVLIARFRSRGRRGTTPTGAWRYRVPCLVPRAALVPRFYIRAFLEQLLSAHQQR